MSGPRISPEAAADLVLWELLAVRPGETVAILTDDASPHTICAALWAALASRGVEAALLRQPSRPTARKNALSPMAAEGLKAVDVMIGLTGSGGAPIYAAEVAALLSAGRLRVMSMVMRDMDILTEGGATADYGALQADGARLGAIWQGGGEMHVTSAAGTDLRAPLATDKVLIECGYATEPGTSAAFSDGEVSSRPIEGQAEGVVVVDGPSAVIGLAEVPFAIRISEGRARAVEGSGPAADRLRRILDEVENADALAELAIGLNPACRQNGKFEEEKKRRGQMHVALGDNIVFGGTIRSEVHLDLCLRAPTATLGGRRLVDAGRLWLDPEV